MLFNPSESEFNVKWTKLPMKVETWMRVSINSHAASEAIFRALKICKLNILLKTYREKFYLQVLLDEKSISYCAMNFHQGLYQFKGLPFELYWHLPCFKNLWTQCYRIFLM